MNLVSLLLNRKKPKIERQAKELAATIAADTNEIRRRLSSIEQTMDELLEQRSPKKGNGRNDGMVSPHH